MWPFSISNVLLFFAGLLTCAAWYLWRRYSYWAERGVPFVKPHWILGNFDRLIKGRESMAEMCTNWYDQLDGERFGGVWELWSPMIVVRDPNILRDIFIRDFDTWPSRGITVNHDSDPLSQNLVNMNGGMWKSVRAKLTPTFTSGKLKQMHHLLLECYDFYQEYLSTLAARNEPIEARELSAKFTTDVIGSCAFGIQMNAIGDQDSTFRIMGKKIFDTDLVKAFKQVMQRSLPKLFKLLKLSIVTPELEKFFLNITKETIAYREANDVQRHDFLDLLRGLKNTGQPLAKDDVEFDDKLLAAQAFVFFAAGFETSSTVISYCLHELAVNQDVQDQVREELHRVRAADNGKVTWDGLKSMKYLHMVVQETMRKYPPVPMLVRTCVKPYQVPDSNLVLPAGMSCFVPVYGIHHDPQYYPDPEKFDPLRFTEENQNKRPAMTFLPFGAGPRFCIGSRFAEQQSKLGILGVVDKFKITLCEKSQNPLEHDPKGRLLMPKGGIWIALTKIEE